MTPSRPEFQREDFERLLQEHEQLITLTNELEYGLHALAGRPNEETLRTLQQSAGALVSALRGYLFRLDQQVLPLVEEISRSQ